MSLLQPALYSRNFVLDSEFLALQFGNFLIGRSGMRECIGKLRFEGLVLGCQLTEVSLK